VHQGLTGHYKDVLTAYWQHTISHLESDTHDYKMHQLPLARIKKVMKADPEVKMISAEAPILFAKGCDIFITELTMRAWIHAEENKRRTLQRSDIASALAKSDMFDFLIDIVPREEASSHAKRTTNQTAAAPQPTAPQPQIPGVGAPNHAGQHPMAAPDYTLGGHNMGPEADYRQPQPMYAGQVQPGAPAYGQPQAQMYNVDDMYTYGTMPPQQVCSSTKLALPPLVSPTHPPCLPCRVPCRIKLTGPVGRLGGRPGRESTHGGIWAAYASKGAGEPAMGGRA
jgi:histone H3/H4